jgi:Tfp pilus assembly protein PilV
MRLNVRPQERAFTIIETSIASVVFTVGLIAIASMAVNGITLLTRTTDGSMAVNLATSTIEGLRVGLPPNGDTTAENQLTFADITGTSAPYYFTRNGEPETDPELARYTVIWQATPSEAEYYTDLVTYVYWTKVGEAPELAEDADHHIALRARLMNPWR